MPEAYEALFKVGQPQGKREEEWILVPGTTIGISTYGRCHTERKPQMHFGSFEKDRKYGRIRVNGKMISVVKLCKQHFHPDKWDFVEPIREEAQAQAADSADSSVPALSQK